MPDLGHIDKIGEAYFALHVLADIQLPTEGITNVHV